MKKMIYKMGLIVISIIMLTPIVYAAKYTLPKGGGNIVGAVQYYNAKWGDDFVSIARKFDVGYYELIEANPGIYPTSPYGRHPIVIPSEYILPKAPHKGIVINVSSMRLFYFPPDEKNVVYTFPIGIGREETVTPLGSFTIIGKRKNPAWYPPKSVREDLAKDGVTLPKVVPPGPENPL